MGNSEMCQYQPRICRSFSSQIVYDEPPDNACGQNTFMNILSKPPNLVSHKAGTPTISERAELLKHLGNWECTGDGYLQRTWLFDDFQIAFDWLNRAGSICHARIGHHARFTLDLGPGRSGTVIETKIRLGLTRADCELAVRLELEAQGQTPTRVTSLA
jgi:pterin-4a-carbinolamine dehydratase